MSEQNKEDVAFAAFPSKTLKLSPSEQSKEDVAFVAFPSKASKFSPNTTHSSDHLTVPLSYLRFTEQFERFKTEFYLWLNRKGSRPKYELFSLFGDLFIPIGFKRRGRNDYTFNNKGVEFPVHLLSSNRFKDLSHWSVTRNVVTGIWLHHELTNVFKIDFFVVSNLRRFIVACNTVSSDDFSWIMLHMLSASVSPYYYVRTVDCGAVFSGHYFGGRSGSVILPHDYARRESLNVEDFPPASDMVESYRRERNVIHVTGDRERILDLFNLDAAHWAVKWINPSINFLSGAKYINKIILWSQAIQFSRIGLVSAVIDMIAETANMSGVDLKFADSTKTLMIDAIVDCGEKIGAINPLSPDMDDVSLEVTGFREGFIARTAEDAVEYVGEGAEFFIAEKGGLLPRMAKVSRDSRAVWNWFTDVWAWLLSCITMMFCPTAKQKAVGEFISLYSRFSKLSKINENDYSEKVANDIIACWQDIEDLLMRLGTYKASGELSARHVRNMDQLRREMGARSKMLRLAQNVVRGARRSGKAFSFMIFGPPGTYKSTFCDFLYRTYMDLAKPGKTLEAHILRVKGKDLRDDGVRNNTVIIDYDDIYQYEDPEVMSAFANHHMIYSGFDPVRPECAALENKVGLYVTPDVVGASTNVSFKHFISPEFASKVQITDWGAYLRRQDAFIQLYWAVDGEPNLPISQGSSFIPSDLARVAVLVHAFDVRDGAFKRCFVTPVEFANFMMETIRQRNLAAVVHQSEWHKTIGIAKEQILRGVNPPQFSEAVHFKGSVPKPAGNVSKTPERALIDERDQTIERAATGMLDTINSIANEKAALAEAIRRRRVYEERQVSEGYADEARSSDSDLEGPVEDVSINTTMLKIEQTEDDDEVVRTDDSDSFDPFGSDKGKVRSSKNPSFASDTSSEGSSPAVDNGLPTKFELFGDETASSFLSKIRPVIRENIDMVGNKAVSIVDDAKFVRDKASSYARKRKHNVSGWIARCELLALGSTETEDALGTSSVKRNFMYAVGRSRHAISSTYDGMRWAFVSGIMWFFSMLVSFGNFISIIDTVNESEFADPALNFLSFWTLLTTSSVGGFILSLGVASWWALGSLWPLLGGVPFVLHTCLNFVLNFTESGSKIIKSKVRRVIFLVLSALALFYFVWRIDEHQIKTTNSSERSKKNQSKKSTKKFDTKKISITGLAGMDVARSLAKHNSGEVRHMRHGAQVGCGGGLAICGGVVVTVAHNLAGIDKDSYIEFEVNSKTHRIAAAKADIIYDKHRDVATFDIPTLAVRDITNHLSSYEDFRLDLSERNGVVTNNAVLIQYSPSGTHMHSMGDIQYKDELHNFVDTSVDGYDVQSEMLLCNVAFEPGTSGCVIVATADHVQKRVLGLQVGNMNTAVTGQVSISVPLYKELVDAHLKQRDLKGKRNRLERSGYSIRGLELFKREEDWSLREIEALDRAPPAINVVAFVNPKFGVYSHADRKGRNPTKLRKSRLMNLSRDTYGFRVVQTHAPADLTSGGDNYRFNKMSLLPAINLDYTDFIPAARMVLDMLPGPLKHHRASYSRSYVVNNNPMMRHNGVFMRTSPGIPFSAFHHNGKAPWLKRNVNEKVVLSPEINSQVDKDLASLDSGEKPCWLVSDSKKDELRPLDAVAIHKTRFIMPTPVTAWIIAMMEFLSFVETIKGMTPFGFSSVGTNIQGATFSLSLKHLLDWIPHEHMGIIAGDYSGYDLNMNRALRELFNWIAIQWYLRWFPDHDVRRKKAFLDCFLEVNHVWKNIVYTTMYGKSSGDFVTTEENCLTNLMAMFIVFCSLFQDNNCEGSPYTLFKRAVRYVFYGDDHVLVCDKRLCPWFTMPSISLKMRSIFGFVYTDAFKQANLPDYESIDNLYFLKRKIIFSDELKCWVGRMDLDVIWTRIRWYRVGDKSPQELMVDTMNSALDDIFFHGRAVFNRERDFMFRALRDCGYRLPEGKNLSNYDDLLKRWQASWSQ